MPKNSCLAKKPWTAAEEKRLAREYPRCKNSQLIEMFGRTRWAIKSRAGLLGITKGSRRLWTERENAILRKHFARTSTREMAGRVNHTLFATHNQAHKLGLSKAADYIKAQLAANAKTLPIAGAVNRFGKGHVPANKGMRRPGYQRGRMAQSWFKKGQVAGAALAKLVPVGTVKVRDGYLMRKISDIPNNGTGALNKNWEYVHVRAWTDAHGPVPKGFRIWWKDGDHNNCAVENLFILSGKDHMARTTIHTLPPELKDVIRVKGALSRRLTYIERKNRDGK